MAKYDYGKTRLHMNGFSGATILTTSAIFRWMVFLIAKLLLVRGLTKDGPAESPAFPDKSSVPILDLGT